MEWPAHLPLIGGGGVSSLATSVSMRWKQSSSKHSDVGSLRMD